MSMLSSLVLATTGLAIANYSLGKSDKNISFKNCLYEKVAIPILNLFDKKAINDTLEVLEIKENYIVVNTQHKTLYAIELSGFDTIEQFVNDLTLTNLYDFASKDPKGYFYQAIFKDESYQKQYLFSYSKDVVEIIAKSLKIKLLKGVQIVDVLFDLFLDNSYYLKSKKMYKQLNIGEDTTVSYFPIEKTFNKIIRNNVYNNLKQLRVYSGYKLNKKMDKVNYNALYELDFKGVIWGYYDFNKERVLQYVENKLNQRKFYGGKEPFIALQQHFEQAGEKGVIVNFEYLSKDSTLSTLNKISEILGVSFEIKRNKLVNTIAKTPIKYRDTRFDLPTSLEFLNSRIGCVHKKTANKPDFYGYDTKEAHINYSFAEENSAPHSIFIAPTGSGKSVAKQKMTAQMLELDFVSGYAPALGLVGGKYGIRNFDVGYSDYPTFKKIQSNKKNDVGEIKGDLKDFKFNVLNIEFDENGEPMVEDMQFSSDLISMILESQSANSSTNGLTIEETGLLKEVLRKLYKTGDYEKHKLRYIKYSHSETYAELLELGYNDTNKLEDIKDEKYSYFKTPLLSDVVKYASIQKNNEQLDKIERSIYSTLEVKLSSIDKLEYFSTYDTLKISDTAYLYTELNSIKESKLFVPIFFGIFWKIYIKDRNRAVKLMRQNKLRPKLIYELEESSNFFRFPTFITMFEKLVYEARKYNIHLMFILQNAEDVPTAIMKNINTRMFLFPPEQKSDIIAYISDAYKPSQKVIETMEKSREHNLIIWYFKGIISMRFDYADGELGFFSTNPNEIR